MLDTTGAGDTFNASLLYGIVNNMPVDRMMRLGAVTAACKCTALGARPGMPKTDQIDSELLQ